MMYYTTGWSFLIAGLGFNSVPLMIVGATWCVVGMLNQIFTASKED